MGLQHTVYRIGSPCGDNYGYFVLRENGHVFGYDSENEKAWLCEGEELVFVSESGNISSRYRMASVEGLDQIPWIGRHERRIYPMYLMPVLTYSPHENAQHLPPAVINSIPKAGTHLVEAILVELGFQPGATMFSWENLVDDFQYEDLLDLEDSEGSRGKICPIDVAVGAIPNGTVILSHTTDGQWINAAEDVGVVHLHCIRNLRDVLVSLYRWKKRGTNSDFSTEDFLNFLQADSSSDISLIRQSTQNILEFGLNQAIRYEDLVQGLNASSPSVDILTNALSMPREAVTAAVRRSVGKPTTTFNATRLSHEDFWNDDIERFFIDSGLHSLNQNLGYDAE